MRPSPQGRRTAGRVAIYILGRVTHTRAMPTPRVLVFDVNETLLDIDSLATYFAQMFDDPAVLRTWFSELILYSMTLTISGQYADFFTLGRSALQMVSTARGLDLDLDEADSLLEAMRTMPAHRDVEDGLRRLRDGGFRLVTLTNSPHRAGRASPLDEAGLSGFFERQFSVDPQRAYKPAPQLYTGVATALGVQPADCTMVAAHAWDLIGAAAAGMGTAFVARSGNAPFRVAGVPQHDLVVDDIADLATRMTSGR